MYKYNEEQFSLPNITPTSHNSNKPKNMPAGGILTMIKARKKQIQDKILKTEHHQSELDDDNKDDQKLRKRIITQVPIYYYRKQSQLKKTPKLHKKQKSGYQEQKIEYLDKYKTERKSYQPQRNREELDVLKAAQENQSSQTFQNQISESELPNSREQSNQRPTKSIKKQNSIETLFLKTPVNPRARNQQNTKQLTEYLIQNNMFFSKISPIIALCILKLNKLFIIDRKKIIYKRNQQINSFFIVLQGRIKIANSQTNFRKVCEAGETIFEQVLFSKGTKKNAIQTARALQRSYLVEIKAENYNKMKEQMMKYGYKTFFIEMQSLLKRNFIMKNWIRNQKQKF